MPGTSVTICGPERALLNPGSVGQPRDGIRDAAYVVLDLDPGSGGARRVPSGSSYDIDRTQRLMREAGLPARLVERLATVAEPMATRRRVRPAPGGAP